MSDAWQNRIVGTGTADPRELAANPRNWRAHPQAQRDVLGAALDEVGWVTGVIVNRRSGLIVDGHLRVSMALERDEAEVPVIYVDLDERAEALALASIDPISSMAERAPGALEELVGGLDLTPGPLEAMLSALTGPPPAPPAPQVHEAHFTYQEQYGVTVICASEDDQKRIYDELVARGYSCKVVVV